MKKKWGFPSARRVLQAVAMRLPVLLLLLLSNRAAAQGSNVLSKRLSYHADGQPLLKVLKDIRDITAVRFTYNADVIRKQPAVTVDVKSVALNEVLKLVLANTGLLFQEDMGGVTIYPSQLTRKEEKQVMQLVTGQVIAVSGGPLQGVTVQAVGSQQGTVTTADGMFSLMADERDELRVSLLGMKTVMQPVRQMTGKVVVIRMDTASREIGEVVVNGYQKIDARMSSASVFKLDAAQVISPGVTSVDQMLQGKVPGLMVMNSSGSVNARPTIRMRGVSTFVGNASPLWVIDNVVRQDPVDISATQLNTAISDMQTGNFSLIGGGISGLNPYDIESITFLRDAAATAIYGVRAANGVIVVTTKKGKAGPMQVTYNTDLSFQQRPSYNTLHLMNSKQRVGLSRELLEDGLIFSDGFNGLDEHISYEGLTMGLYARQFTEAAYKTAVQKLETNNTDWFKVLFRNSFSMNHSIGVSGGMGKTTYYGSLSYTNAMGAGQLDGNKRFTGKLSLHNETTKRLSFDFTLSGSYVQSEGYYQTSPLSYALETNRAISPDAFYPLHSNSNQSLPIPSPVLFNMKNELAQTENNANERGMIAEFIASYKIIDGLTFRNTTSAQMDVANQMSAAYAGSYYIGNQRGWNLDYSPTDLQISQSPMPYGGLATISNLSSNTYDIRNDVNYSKSLFQNRDMLILAAGNEIQSTRTNGLASVNPGYYPDRGQQFATTSNSRDLFSKQTITNTVKNILSFYGTATYSLNSKYALTATVRTDGSNRFGQYSNARFLPNYGLSGKWDIGRESWLTNSRVFSGLTVRTSFGTQGNVVDAVGPELIASYGTAGQVDFITHIPYLSIKSLAYPDLRWEKTNQWNFGLDLALLDGRVNLNADYYLKTSKDLITSKPIAYEYGIDQMWVNAGKAKNTGVDIVLSVTAIRSRNTGLTFRFINGWVKNQIAQTGTTSALTSYFDGQLLLSGRPRSGFYSFSYKGLNPANGLPLFNYMDKAPSSDPTNFLKYSGQLYPKFDGGVSSEFRYKAFTISADFHYALGASKRLNPLFDRDQKNTGVPSPFANVNVALEHRWRKPGDEAHTNIPSIVSTPAVSDEVVLPLVVQGTTSGMTTGSVSYYAYDAYDLSDLRVVNSSYVRCRSLRLTYMVSPGVAARVGLKGAKVGLFVNNAFTIASRSLQGQDPEIDGVGVSVLPVTRQYGLSIGVNF